ncbi:hypothetical protein [Micromonospora sp. KC721]|uniref:hypothetical protein n=1 Tax=Micromonospora sp. KC721 TaxID=2530380 RepID=UPI001FB5C634|nr:hypothetical protein [Micromonospora sp. KC721]
MNERPSPGDLLIVDGAASVQFAGNRALRLRVVSVGADEPYPGWLWLTGYVLDRRDQAVAKREIYVQLSGLRLAAHVDPPALAVAHLAGSRPPAHGVIRPPARRS